MTELLLVLLTLVSVACALVLALGGRRGRVTANPWWSLLAGVSLLLTLHVLGYYLPGVAWLPWVGLVGTLVGAVPAGLREREIWQQALMPTPGERVRYMEVALFFVAVLGARSLQPLLPQVHWVALVLVVFLPLFLARWAATRLRRSEFGRG